MSSLAVSGLDSFVDNFLAAMFDSSLTFIFLSHTECVDLKDASVPPLWACPHCVEKMNRPKVGCKGPKYLLTRKYRDLTAKEIEKERLRDPYFNEEVGSSANIAAAAAASGGMSASGSTTTATAATTFACVSVLHSDRPDGAGEQMTQDAATTFVPPDHPTTGRKSIKPLIEMFQSDARRPTCRGATSDDECDECPGCDAGCPYKNGTGEQRASSEMGSPTPPLQRQASCGHSPLRNKNAGQHASDAARHLPVRHAHSGDNGYSKSSQAGRRWPSTADKPSCRGAGCSGTGQQAAKRLIGENLPPVPHAAKTKPNRRATIGSCSVKNGAGRPATSILKGHFAGHKRKSDDLANFVHNKFLKATADQISPQATVPLVSASPSAAYLFPCTASCCCSPTDASSPAPQVPPQSLRRSHHHHHSNHHHLQRAFRSPSPQSCSFLHRHSLSDFDASTIGLISKRHTLAPSTQKTLTSRPVTFMRHSIAGGTARRGPSEFDKARERERMEGALAAKSALTGTVFEHAGVVYLPGPVEIEQDDDDDEAYASATECRSFGDYSEDDDEYDDDDDDEVDQVMVGW